MKSRSELFDLVHSLLHREQMELRTYLCYRMGKEGSNPERLLQLITQGHDNDDSLKECLGDVPLARNLHSEKHQLYQLILQHLAGIRWPQDELGQARVRYTFAKTLWGRGFAEAAQRQLEKAMELSRDSCQWTLLMDCLQFERRLIKAGKSKKIEEEMDKNLSEVSRALVYLETEAQIKALHDRLFILTRTHYRQNLSSSDKWLTEVGEKLDSLRSNSLPFESQRALLNARVVWCQVTCQPERAYDECMMLLDYWSLWPQRIKANIREYRLTLANFLNIGHEARSYEKFKDVLQTFRALPLAETPEERGDTEQTIFLFTLLSYLHTGQFRLAETHALKLKEWEKRLEVDKLSLIPSRRMAIYYNCAVTHFVVGRYENAYGLWQRVVQSEWHGHRNDLRVCANLLSLIVLISTEQLSMAAAGIEALRKRPTAQDYLGAFERVSLNALARLCNQPEPRHADILRSWKKELESIHAQSSHSIGGLTEVLIWVNSKIYRKTMEEVFVENASH